MSFFILNDLWNRGYTRASRAAGDPRGPADTCGECGECISMLKWLPPFRAIIEQSGPNFGDLVVGLPDDELLVSERFADLWRQHKLRGLSAFDPVDVVKVETRRKKLPPIPRYLRVKASVGPGRIDAAASGLEWLRPPTCPLCQSGLIARWRRVAIAPDNWQGEDIFVPIGFPATLLVSDRFKSFCEEHQVRNANFTPAQEYGHDFYSSR